MIVEILLKIHFPVWCCWNVSLCLHARFLLFPLILSRVFMFPLTSQKERHDDINNVRVAPPPASSQTRPHGSNCERDPGRKWRDLSMLISLETNRCVSPYLEAYGDSESAVKRAAAKYAAAGVCKRWLGRFMHAEMGSVHQVQAGDLEKNNTHLEEFLLKMWRKHVSGLILNTFVVLITGSERFQSSHRISL